MEASAGTTTTPAIAVNQADAGRRQNTGLGLHVALQDGLTDASEVRSHLLTAEFGPVPPIGVAKTSALVLSSLGMLSVISLLRLNRTL
jgi:hypothetical protein